MTLTYDDARRRVSAGDDPHVVEPGPYDIAVGLRAHDPNAVVTRVDIG